LWSRREKVRYILGLGLIEFLSEKKESTGVTRKYKLTQLGEEVFKALNSDSGVVY